MLSCIAANSNGVGSCHILCKVIIEHFCRFLCPTTFLNIIKVSTVVQFLICDWCRYELPVIFVNGTARRQFYFLIFSHYYHLLPDSFALCDRLCQSWSTL